MMKQLVMTAHMGGSSIAFKHGPNSALEPNKTFRFVLDCTPNHHQSIGWHPWAHSHGFGLHGEPFPTCTLDVVDMYGNPVTNFTLEHTITVHIVSSTKGGRLSALRPIVPIQLMPEAVSGTSYHISGVTQVLYGPAWVKLLIIVDGKAQYDIPLWPVGYPTYLLRGIPLLSGADYHSVPLSTPIDIIPYLSKTLSNHTYDMGHILQVNQLLAGVDPASFFVKPHVYRAKYNAGALHQSNQVRGYLEPVVDPMGKFYLNGSPSRYTPITVGYDSFVTLHSTGPIMLLEGTMVKTLGSTYDVATETWITEVPVQFSSFGLISPNLFSNYHLSGTSMNITNRATTLTIQAADPKKPIRMTDFAAPLHGDLAVVAFDPSSAPHFWLLDPLTNPYNWFFFKSQTGVSALGSVTQNTVLQVGPTITPVLPPWTEAQPTLPLYLVEFNGRKWVPYTLIDGLPISVTFDPIQLINSTTTSTSFLQGDPTNLTGSFAPFVISGSPINAGYIV